MDFELSRMERQVPGALYDLREHGLVDEPTGLEWERLVAHLNSGRRSAYCGFDPTAPSLHLGNLVPIMALRRLQRYGHRPIVLIGGGTGLIGDPSGKKDERRLNSAEVVSQWAHELATQVRTLLDFDHGPARAELVNNADWITDQSIVQFLRDVGKHFRVGEMIGKAFVRDRLAAGISFTEFTYTLLQANDYAHLNRRFACTIQIGGRDQWGNIVHGIDYLRRSAGAEGFGVTTPLLIKTDGSKFGKSEQGNLWLDPKLTSPFAMHQHFLQAADADVAAWLPIFTTSSREEVASLLEEHARSPGLRLVQNRLADEVVSYVHGTGAVVMARRAAAILFGEINVAVDAQAMEELGKLAGVSYRCEGPTSVVDLLVGSGLATSKRVARQLVESGAVFWNGLPIDRNEDSLPEQRIFDRFAVLRRGRREAKLVTFA